MNCLSSKIVVDSILKYFILVIYFFFFSEKNKSLLFNVKLSAQEKIYMKIQALSFWRKEKQNKQKKKKKMTSANF